MSNTSTKVNSFIALGYTFLASCSPLEEPENPASEETSVEESSKTFNEIKEDILPTNNQVLKTIDYQRVSSGLRI